MVRAARGTELTPIVWASNLLVQENIENILDPERYIVHFRNSGRDRSLAAILDKGYRVVFSNRDAWQFDCGFGDWVRNNKYWIGCSTKNNAPSVSTTHSFFD